MARTARTVAVDVPHHVTQRGNNQQTLFFDDEDRRFYLCLLENYIRKFNVDMLGFSLMTNHVHLVLLPPEANALAKALGKVHSRYSQHNNLKQGRSGHLWQNRFFSCPLEPPDLWSALCYIERNPVRARMVKQAWDYPWSSARAHVTGHDPSGLLSMDLWQAAFTPAEWRKMLETPEEPGMLTDITNATRHGRY
ncbi:MAG: transposase [Acidobacteriia bacterium]|nr:transposase [Terriglobia bacterium]